MSLWSFLAQLCHNEVQNKHFKTEIMKKVTFFAAAIALLGIASVDANAQSTQQEQTQQTQPAEQQAQDNGKVKVTQEELPEPVKSALKSDVYKDWTVGDIYKVSPAEGSTEGQIVYEINMTNAQGQAGVVKMNEKGGDASSK